MRLLTPQTAPVHRKGRDFPASARAGGRHDSLAAPEQLKPHGSNCACGGSCPRCQQAQPGQTALAISRPGDVAEREADRAVEHVLSTPAPHQADVHRPAT